MKLLTLEGSAVHVSNVGKASLILVPVIVMKELTLQRNLWV
jgi:hypothetical protein